MADLGDKNGATGSKLEGDSEQVEVHPTGRATAGQKVQRHFKRFWWLHLIIFCATVLIIALPLVYVGMPRIAQTDVDKTTLSFLELQFLEPTPDSVVLSQVAALHNPNQFTPSLDPFTSSLWLLTDGTFDSNPFTTIDFPPVHALHPVSNVEITSQTLHITDTDQLAQYATQVLTQQNVTTALTGRTQLHLGKLPTVWINYNSTTTYPCLNGLKGFNTTDLRIDLSAKSGQPNLRGNAYVPNPSNLTVALGNVTLSLSTPKSGVLGNATINNLTLRPGDNNFPLTAIVNQATVIQNLDSHGVVTLDIKGTSSVYNGVHIPYYEKALSVNPLQLPLNITQILADSQ